MEEMLLVSWRRASSMRFSDIRRFTSSVIAPLSTELRRRAASFRALNLSSSFWAFCLSTCKVAFDAFDSRSCSCNRSMLTMGEAARADGSVTWSFRPSMTSVKPLIVSRSCSCNSFFSLFVFLNTLSDISFCCMVRFNSLMSRSNIMQLFNRLSGGRGFGAPTPAVIGCTGNNCRNIAAEEMCFLAWKHRTVSAIKSRAVRECADSANVRESDITNSNLVVSRGWISTFGRSKVYSQAISLPPLPWAFAIRTESDVTLMVKSC
mmetsp:Transcript_85056/g.214334  ORF Transcript_85056/g.214334 Transcript_85056/m.214334 type:complete len:263 (-) Transcript_85056:606-1394(-)